MTENANATSPDSAAEVVPATKALLWKRLSEATNAHELDAIESEAIAIGCSADGRLRKAVGEMRAKV